MDKVILRKAFMTGYRRQVTWEALVRSGEVFGSKENRSAYMAGYRRQTTWETYIGC